ncbi:MAG: hypothetical protein KAV83_08850 [Desulfobacterales bacterium]|nr:hypothetical protein [Desulfobacterales bacterium]
MSSSISNNSSITEMEKNKHQFAQLRSYLRATSLKVGLLVNFSRPTLGARRVVN